MDGQEIEIVAKEIEKNGQKYMKVYAKILSHPNKVDTDGDGYDDKSDINPLKWDISDRDLAMSADIVYHNIPKGTKFDKIRTSWKGTVNKRFDGVASIEELKGWSVLGTHYTNVGLQAAAFKKDNNIVVAYRGQEKVNPWEFTMDWIVADGLGIITGFNAQAPGAKSFIKNVMKHNPNANIFITGHSLGGNLAYNAASKAIDINREAVVKVNTYNGFGLLLGLSLGLTDLVDEQRLMSQREKITDYVVEGDSVYNLWFTFHYGTKELFTQSDGAKDAHSLYTFFDKLPPFDRTNRY